MYEFENIFGLIIANKKNMMSLFGSMTNITWLCLYLWYTNIKHIILFSGKKHNQVYVVEFLDQLWTHNLLLVLSRSSKGLHTIHQLQSSSCLEGLAMNNQ